MTTERMIGNIHLARQIFKHDGVIYFRIYASVFPLPKRLDPYKAIYRLEMHTDAVDKLKMHYMTYANDVVLREFKDWDSARDFLIGKIFTVSRQFGFRGYLVPKEWSI